MCLRLVKQLLQFLGRLGEGRQVAWARLANQTALVEACLQRPLMVEEEREVVTALVLLEGAKVPEAGLRPRVGPALAAFQLELLAEVLEFALVEAVLRWAKPIFVAGWVLGGFGWALESGLGLGLGLGLALLEKGGVGREFQFQVLHFSINLPFLNQAKPYWLGKRGDSCRNHARCAHGLHLN